MTFCALGILFAAMTTQDAIVTLLNSASSTSPGRYAEAQKIVLRDAEDGKPLQQFVVGVTTKDERLPSDSSRRLGRASVILPRNGTILSPGTCSRWSRMTSSF